MLHARSFVVVWLLTLTLTYRPLQSKVQQALDPRVRL